MSRATCGEVYNNAWQELNGNPDWASALTTMVQLTKSKPIRSYDYLLECADREYESTGTHPLPVAVARHSCYDGNVQLQLLEPRLGGAASFFRPSQRHRRRVERSLDVSSSKPRLTIVLVPWHLLADDGRVRAYYAHHLKEGCLRYCCLQEHTPLAQADSLTNAL